MKARATSMDTHVHRSGRLLRRRHFRCFFVVFDDIADVSGAGSANNAGDLDEVHFC